MLCLQKIPAARGWDSIAQSQRLSLYDMWAQQRLQLAAIRANRGILAHLPGRAFVCPYLETWLVLLFLNVFILLFWIKSNVYPNWMP